MVIAVVPEKKAVAKRNNKGLTKVGPFFMDGSYWLKVICYSLFVKSYSVFF